MVRGRLPSCMSQLSARHEIRLSLHGQAGLCALWSSEHRRLSADWSWLALSVRERSACGSSTNTQSGAPPDLVRGHGANPSSLSLILSLPLVCLMLQPQYAVPDGRMYVHVHVDVPHGRAAVLCSSEFSDSPRPRSASRSYVGTEVVYELAAQI